MLKTTLCYIEKDNKYLLLHRIKKENDMNRDKWIGVGGKIEEGETAQECIIREVREETGLTLNLVRFRGIIYFRNTYYSDEDMYLFTSKDFSGELKECDEGVLEWVDKDKVCLLPIWEGDRIFLNALTNDDRFFELTLNYDRDSLISHKIVYKT